MHEESHAEWDCVEVDIDKLGAKQLATLRGALRGILFTTLVYAVGQQAAEAHHREIHQFEVFSAPISLRKSDQQESIDDGFCTPEGCYVWATAWNPTDGGGGGWGSGTGGTGSSSGGSGPPPDPPAIPWTSLPDPVRLNCVATEYGDTDLKPKWGPSLNNIWAFTTLDTDHEAFSVDTPDAPPGFAVVDGDTAIGTDWYGGGTTILYADGMIAHDGKLNYVDPDTGLSGSVNGPFTAFETAIMTFAHEVRHQYGKDDEDMADGYGVKVMLKYRSDGGRKCK